MIKNRWVAFLTSFCFLFLLIAPFQNCSGDKGDESSSPDGEMRIVDDWRNSKVMFHETLVVTHQSANNILFEGFCDRREENDVLNWELVDVASNSLLDEGQVQCQWGSFDLLVEQMNGLDCGKDYELIISDVNGSTGSTVLRRKCEPQSSLSSGEENCFFELELNGSCYYACYEGGKLKYHVDTAANACQ